PRRGVRHRRHRPRGRGALLLDGQRHAALVREGPLRHGVRLAALHGAAPGGGVVITPRRLKRRGLRVDLKEDPFSLLINFVDCSLVFALGFMIALLAKPAASADASGPPAPEPIAGKIERERLRVTPDTASGEGVRLGTAYRLSN